MDVEGEVVMAATSGMTIAAQVLPFPPPLIDQIMAVVGQDPALIGATGYLDEVFTSRLMGDPD
jgi:hypothetical protein